MNGILPSAWLLLVIALGLATTALMLRAFARARRMGDQPHCRKCDYGLPTRDTRICPECGFAQPSRGPAIGRRKKSPVLRTASAIALLGAVLVGLIAGVRFANYNFLQHAPDSWVMAASERGYDAAVDELESRVAAVTMTAFAPRIVALACTRIDTLWTVFDAPPQEAYDWTDLVIDLASHTPLTPADTERFIDTTTRLEVESPVNVRLGDMFKPTVSTRSTLPSSIQWQGRRFASALSINSTDVSSINRLSRTKPTAYMTGSVPIRGSGGSASVYYRTEEWAGAGVTPGPGTFTIEYVLSVTDPTAPGTPLLADLTRTFTEPLEVLPADAVLPDRMVNDIALARAHWSSTQVYVEQSSVRLRANGRVPSDVVIAHRVDVLSDGVPDDGMGTTFGVTRLGGTDGYHSLINTSTYTSFGDIDQRVDVAFTPNPEFYSRPNDPNTLAFGVRFEGIPIQGTPASWRDEPWPRPQRIVLIDREGNDVEEIAIEADGWSTEAPDDGTLDP